MLEADVLLTFMQALNLPMPIPPLVHKLCLLVCLLVGLLVLIQMALLRYLPLPLRVRWLQAQRAFSAYLKAMVRLS